MPSKARQTVKITCTAEGYENLWVEFDVTDWGLGVYFRLYKTLNIPEVITEFIPQYSTNWHMVDADGKAIKHPGRGASDEVWATVLDQFDVDTSRAIHGWLWTAALLAYQESLSFSPKSSGGNKGGGGSARREKEGAAA